MAVPGRCMIRCFEQGLPHSNDIDVSRGLETVPIRVHEGDASNADHVLERSYTYVRSSGIHASVIEGFCSSHLGSTADNCKSQGTCTDFGNECSCHLGDEKRHYVENGLLHPRYIIQVRM